jgi:hypothetical protein
MNEIEKYHFDLEGYILVKGILSKAEAAEYLAAADALEEKVSATPAGVPSFTGHYGIEYYTDDALGVFHYESISGGGRQVVVDDFLNASSAFDPLIGHAPTMAYVRELASGPYRLTSSELRIRYKNNKTFTHMGGPIDPRNRYEFAGRPVHDAATGARIVRTFDLVTVRVLYALHDLPMENGPLCVVPGSHKANFFSPYGEDPVNEPGMIGLPMEAGDALFFTENLRHGGLPNVLDKARKTIHLTIGPRWATSQSPAHWDGDVHVSPAAWERYSEVQRALLPIPGARIAADEIRRLRNENEFLRRELRDWQHPQHRVPDGSNPSGHGSLSGMFSRVLSRILK